MPFTHRTEVELEKCPCSHKTGAGSLLSRICKKACFKHSSTLTARRGTSKQAVIWVRTGGRERRQRGTRIGIGRQHGKLPQCHDPQREEAPEWEQELCETARLVSSGKVEWLQWWIKVGPREAKTSGVEQVEGRRRGGNQERLSSGAINLPTTSPVGWVAWTQAKNVRRREFAEDQKCMNAVAHWWVKWVWNYQITKESPFTI